MDADHIELAAQRTKADNDKLVEAAEAHKDGIDKEREKEKSATVGCWILTGLGACAAGALFVAAAPVTVPTAAGAVVTTSAYAGAYAAAGWTCTAAASFFGLVSLDAANDWRKKVNRLNRCKKVHDSESIVWSYGSLRWLNLFLAESDLLAYFRDIHEAQKSADLSLQKVLDALHPLRTYVGIGNNTHFAKSPGNFEELDGMAASFEAQTVESTTLLNMIKEQGVSQLAIQIRAGLRVYRYV